MEMSAGGKGNSGNDGAARNNEDSKQKVAGIRQKYGLQKKSGVTA
jgi:hypothetical protein